MRKDPKAFPFAENLPDLAEYGADFSPETKYADLLKDALKGAPECRICGARYQPGSVNSDHRISKSNGGMGRPSNHDPAHFYCNGGKCVFKPMIEAANLKFDERKAREAKVINWDEY
jgi:hypothetical protein